MRVGFSIDPRQGLSEADELRLVELGARLGYEFVHRLLLDHFADLR